MNTVTIRGGFGLGLVLLPLLGAWADDPPAPDIDPPPQPAPAVPIPPAFGPQSGQQYTTPAGPGRGPYWAPGGDPINGMRVGSPYYWSAPGMGPTRGWQAIAPGMGDGYGCAVGGAGYGGFGSGYSAAYPGAGGVYAYHFGPGFHRYANAGYTRFPYYSYRRPWYFPGPPAFNRDTNLPW